MKKLIVALAMTFLMLMAIDISNVLAEPKPKEGNPGLPGCLAKVDQQEQIIADQQAQIEALQALLESMMNYAPVPKTGQTVSREAGDDGDLQKGIIWPNPRFTDNADGTVTDNLTGLIWLKNANCFGAKTWADALNDCNNLQDGTCGLTDNSCAGDWRLPNVRELQSLVDYGRYNPTFQEIHPFLGLVAGRYWSSTTYSMYTPDAWLVNFYFGYVNHDGKSVDFYVWPVRDAK
jgi:hypothetical protein